EAWEESKFTKPLEITTRFANDENIMASKKGQGHLKLLDLTYMDHLMSRRKVNLPRVMIRHMSYVISMKDHELPYGDWLTMVFEALGVPLVDKKGEEPKRYDYFEETFLTMCKLTRENGVWWIGSGENRRRDDIDVPAEEEDEKEVENQTGFDWEAVIGEAATEGESGSGERFYDAEDEAHGSPDMHDEIPAANTHGSAQQKEQTTSGVDLVVLPSRNSVNRIVEIPVEFERKRANRFHDDLEKAKAENARLLALLHQAQSKPHP
ncbi:hypothetical protein Dimus_022598, partial [Dionaea muscipula]